MKPPKPVNPRDDHASQAPYNFVPLAEPVYPPRDPLPDHGQHAPERLSGQIEIALRTETGLYTRSAVPPEQASDEPSRVWEPNSPYRDFFHHGDPSAPVVPGSSLRGMLRQLVEVLSDGRLDTAPTDEIVYRAVGDTTRFGWFYKRRFVGPNTDPANRGRDGHTNPNPTSLPQRVEYPVRVPNAANPWNHYAVHGGYLFRDGRQWYIRPAKQIPAGSHETFVHVDAANLPASLQPWHHNRGVHPVWVVPARRSSHGHPKVVHGHVQMLTLDHALTDKVWERRKGPRPKPHPQAEPALLVMTDSLRDAHGVPNKHMHCAIFEPDPKQRIDVPPKLQRLYRADTAISRAGDREGRLLPAEPPLESAGGERVPCFYMVDQKGELVFLGGTLFFRLPYEKPPRAFQNAPGAPDLASRLFGTLNGPEGVPVKGRLRFEDLTWDRTQGPDDPFVGIRYPMPLLAPKPACIQHYLVQRSDEKKDLLHYDDHPYHGLGLGEETTALRGFKHYWHRKDRDQPERVVGDHAPAEPPPARPPTQTVIRPVREGVVFRGRIHFDNLSPVELGALLVALDLKRNLRHKLGMARPFGFGSVKIERKQTRIVDPAARYASFFPAGEQGRSGMGAAGSPSDPSNDTGLQAGWRPDSETVAIEAKKAFCTELAGFRGSNLAKDVTEKEASREFWASDRMRDLAALLEWDERPDWRKTAQVPVTDPQWKERRVLPPPIALLQRPHPRVESPESAVISPADQEPTGDRGSPSASSSTSMAQAFLEAAHEPRRQSRPDRGERIAASPGASATMSVRPGQARTGKLAREGSSWVAVLDGDAGIAKILNEDSLPAVTREGSPARFRVERATGYSGIQVIYEGLAE